MKNPIQNRETLLNLNRCWEKNIPFQPYQVKFKVTEQCNLRCAICSYWKQKGRDLNTEIVLKNLDELKSMNTKKIYFTGGEPLLHKGLFKMIKKAEENGFESLVLSNGTLIDEKNAEKLLTHGLDAIDISLWASEEKIHDKLRGIKGSWKKAISAFKFINKIRMKINPKFETTMTFVITPLNLNDLPNIIRLSQHLEVNELDLFVSRDFLGGEGKAMELNEEETIRLKEIYKTLTHNPHEVNLTKTAVEKLFENIFLEKCTPVNCYVPWLHFLINVDGNVYPCCHALEQDPKGSAVGNILEESISKIWAGPRFKESREKIKKTKLRYCYNCIYYDLNKALTESIKLF